LSKTQNPQLDKQWTFIKVLLAADTGEWQIFAASSAAGVTKISLIDPEVVNVPNFHRKRGCSSRVC
jgi:hypothetical protein